MVLLGIAKPGATLLPANWPANEQAQALTGKKFIGHVETRVEKFTGYNVAGIIRGTDPRVNKTYVAFGSHYDHVGIQSGGGADSIANGADDDGSGSVTMLAIAKSMTTARPRRSTLFVWHAAEEKGLLGSEFFASNPTVPIDSIVAAINIDMIGRRGGASSKFDSRVDQTSGENRLFVLGPASAPNGLSVSLGAIFDTVNARQVRPFIIDRAFDDPNHPEHYYDRSDHINYAKKGIPIIFFSTGFHEDYHKVSDEASKIDYDKMSRIGGLLIELATTLGNREARPR
jgi:Zn-dependent M28 family amino/carboxypeptidase